MVKGGDGVPKGSSPRRGAGSAADVEEEGARFDAWEEARYNRATPRLGSRGLRRWPKFQGRHTTTSSQRTERAFAGLAGRDRLSFAGGEALPPICRNRSIDDGSAVNALPCVEYEEEV